MPNTFFTFLITTILPQVKAKICPHFVHSNAFTIPKL
nr:MAG TPA: hypothetical protein [Siphoviridae sp. ctpCx1]